MAAAKKRSGTGAVAKKMPVKKAAAKTFTVPKKHREPVEASKSPTAGGAELVERVARAVERELAEIESIVGGLKGRAKPTEAERRARTLASLARTLSEVRRLRAADDTRKPDDEPSAARDLEEFRKILFRRLENMPGRPETLPDGGNDVGGDA